MENVFLYLIKASGLITVFYLAYILLLRKETFFTGNRWFLLLGLFTSAILPLFFITKIIWVEPTTNSFDWSNIQITTVENNPEPEINWSLIAIVIYFLGSIVLFAKLLFDFYSLSKVFKGKVNIPQGKFKLIDVTENIAPFSFFKSIVYNSTLYTPTELENILEHEKVHSSQNHSVDVLLSRLFCIAFWFNPLIWLYKKAIIQNLEFIADSEAAKNSSDKKAYQLTLLKITTQENCVSITNHFYQSLIKKRIIMMNKNQSKKWNSWKYITVFPALVAFVFLFQIEVVAQEKEIPKQEIEKKSLEDRTTEIIVTKNTTDEELKKYCEELKKTHDIDLSFFNIKRSENGEIINIKSKFKSPFGSGTNFQSRTPIKPFKFFYENSSVGYLNLDFSSISNDDNVYIDGKKSTQEKLDQLKPYEIEKIDVATISGKKTILVTTKKQIEPDKFIDKEIYIDGIHSNYEEFSRLDKNRIDRIDITNEQKTVRITTKPITNEKPLIVVNGMLMKPDFDISKIDPSSITRTEVSTGIQARGNYGIEHPYVIAISTSDEKYAPKVDLEKAYVIIDGKEADYETFLNLRGKVKNISTNLYNYENTSKANKSYILREYGLKGKNGVLVVKTTPLDKEVNGWKVSSEPVKDGPLEDTANRNKINYLNSVVIINGKVSNYARESHLLNPDKITSIKVQKIADSPQKYKDEMVSKYGEKALNGIVEIETK